jgi:plasmid stability protein
MATLYLRSLPEDLVREAKAAAARRGLTLTAFVREALARAVGIETPAAPAREAPRQTPPREVRPEGLEADMAWYESRRRSLVRRYRGEYLAIVNRRVADHDREFDRLARRMFRRFGVRPIYMPKCEGEERVVTVASPRVARA